MKKTAVVLRRTIPASPERVFQAWSDPEMMQRWLFPDECMQVEVEADFRVGGVYTLLMHNDQGETYPHKGIYKEIVANEKVVFTWSSDWVDDSLVTVELKKAGAATELTLTHELPDRDGLADEHKGGWTGALNHLRAFCNPA